MRQQALAEAKLLLRTSEVGVISTISKNLRGYPFGSVTPYISDSEGHLYFYISDIAQHASNMQADSRMSLTIYQQKSEGDQNENARLTVVGDCEPMQGNEHDDMLARYVRRYPDAKAYEQAHDFKMWKVKIKRVRYIGGFGKIFWLEKDEWMSTGNPWDKSAEDAMIEHMDDDHQDAMALILAQHTGVYDDEVTMSGIQTDGCYLRSKGNNIFVPFESLCVEQGDARKQLVALTQSARQAG